MKNFFAKCDQNPQFPGYVITFTEEILNGKLHFHAESWTHSSYS